MTKPSAWLAMLLLVGCDAFEPWVGELPPGEVPPQSPCQGTAECTLLEEIEVGAPPFPAAPPEPRCADGSSADELVLAEDARLDAAALACTELSVEVVASASREDETPIELELAGSVLSDARVRVRSASRPVIVRLAVATVRDVVLEGEGPVSVAAVDAELERVRIAVHASHEVEAPTLRVERGSHHDLEVTLPVGVLRVTEAAVTRGHLELERLSAQRSSMSATFLRAESAALIGVDFDDSTLDVLELSAGGGTWLSLDLVRCASLYFSRVFLRSSRLAACDEPAVLDEVEANESVFLGDVRGRLGYYEGGAFAGARVELQSRIHRTAFCGVSRVSARELLCMRCEPASPPDVCGLVDGYTGLCPGVCEARCSDGSLRFGGASCRGPDE